MHLCDNDSLGRTGYLTTGIAMASDTAKLRKHNINVKELDV
jgi:hypothetical protein